MNPSEEYFETPLPLAEQLYESLLRRYGPMISGDDLRIALGYPSKDAFRQAIVRTTVPVTVFSIEQRRGKFALTKDVAAWLAEQRHRAAIKPDQEKDAP